VRVPEPAVVLLAAAALLALRPAQWLIQSWSDPAYNPQGAGVALAVAALALWSWCSEQQPGTEPNRRYAFALLAFSAAVRLVGQLLRVNLIAALTLAIDVYALATLAGLRQRRRAVSPLWLSVLFAFSLPLERAAQRLVGYGLQQLSADGACGILGWLTDGVRCVGTRILLGGQDLLVDLPCSGARGLMWVLMLYAGLSALKRPSWPQALLGLLLALAGALLANTLRIVALALGLAWAPGVDFADGYAHEALGVLALVLAAAPVALWANRLPVPRQAPFNARAASSAPSPAGGGRSHPHAVAYAWALLGFAIVAVSVPAHPVDVARAVAAPTLPAHIATWSVQPQALSDIEQAYFARYGGGAAKAAYGPYGLLLVSTSAPLRHLHAPDECLRGSGYRVRYLGLADAGLPTAMYRAVAPDGRSWRVAVSYVSDRGEHAASVAEAVWHWLRAPGGTWTMVQRLSPWDADDAGRMQWDSALMHALDLPAAAVDRFHRVPETRKES
jgi:exosortase